MDKKTRNNNAGMLEQIVRIIIEYKKPEKILIYGSRAKGSFKKTSDIDIAIFAKDWTNKDINLVKHRLDEELITPLKVDVVNFYDLEKKSLKGNILKEGRVLYER